MINFFFPSVYKYIHVLTLIEILETIVISFCSLFLVVWLPCELLLEFFFLHSVAKTRQYSCFFVFLIKGLPIVSDL